MKLKKQKSVLMLTEWSDARFHYGVARYAKEAGWHLILDSVYNQTLPWGWQGDGCIAMVAQAESMKFLRSLEVPVVDLTSHQADQAETGFSQIHQDDVAIGELAARHLLGLGFKHFAYYCSEVLDGPGFNPENICALERRNGFVEELATSEQVATSLCWDATNDTGPDGWANHKRFLTKELEKLPKPVAIFCIDDRMAVNIIDACMDCGIDIPSEIAVLGVGNLEIPCECSAVPISSVRIDFEELGYQSASLLDDRFKGRRPPASAIRVPPVGIEERRSTYTLAVDDPGGRKAVRFMLDEFTSPIGAREIAEAGGLTRSQWTYICQKEWGRGPAALLEDIRMKTVLKLLGDTDFTIGRVALESGLGTALRLQRIFQRRLGTSPGAWRKAQREKT